MDHRRFDELARLAAFGDRRRLLSILGLAAVAIYLHPRIAVARSQGVVVPGGACSTSSECRQGSMEGTAVCAENGFSSDGALNCCATSGCCGSDDECCGDYRCAPTGDVCYVCSLPPFPTRGLGQPCSVDEDCIPLASSTYFTRCIRDICTSDLEPSPPPRPISDAESALQAAEAFSALEANGDFAALYARMHPDAQAVVPQAAVVGWYADAFAPTGPRPAEAKKVRFVEWEWPVTGEVYPGTAEVAFRQEFADGTVIRDEVRLVKGEEGAWSWFFGRDRAFVEEQIARYGR